VRRLHGLAAAAEIRIRRHERCGVEAIGLRDLPQHRAASDLSLDSTFGFYWAMSQMASSGIRCTTFA
jgi:hypothetical protein